MARVFKELDYIEQWGSGIKRILNSCEKYDLKEPIIRETGDSVDVSIFRRKIFEKFKYIKNNKTFFTEQENQIIDYLVKNESIKRKEVEEVLNIKTTRAYQIINILLKNDVIKKVGKGPSTRYILR
ncbi:MAG: ATP-binding protein [Bacillota bacterium]